MQTFNINIMPLHYAIDINVKQQLGYNLVFVFYTQIWLAAVKIIGVESVTTMVCSC